MHIGDFTINRQSGNNAISDYQLFICVPDFSDLDPKSVNIRTSEHNLKAHRIIKRPFVSTSGKRYYRISFDAAPREERSVGSNAVINANGYAVDSSFLLSYDIVTDKKTPPGDYPYSEQIFVNFKNYANM